MKKILLSLLVIVAFGIYALHQHNEDNQAILTVQKGLPTPTALVTNTPTPENSGASPSPLSNTPTITPISRGKYKDGTYNGDVTDAFYGNVQVQVAISGGRITGVQFLQYPNDRGTSREINSQAMPYLQQEAIQAQNATVDIVSGATQTSQAFIESLQSALNQAKA